MTEDLNSGTGSVDQGQALVASGDSPISGQGTPDQGGGQPADGGLDQTGSGSQPDSIFDPDLFDQRISEASPELQEQFKAFRRDLLADYTRKTQAAAQKSKFADEDRKKLDAYNAFLANPEQVLGQVVQQMGMRLVPASGGNDNSLQTKWNPDSGNPENWHEPIDYMKAYLKAEMDKVLSPLINNVQQSVQKIEKDSIEHRLAEIDPSWQQYEDKMKENLRVHPTLVNDPSLLYRMSVPAEVLESRATQRALAKMEAKTKSGQMGGASQTTKKPGQAIDAKPRGFEEAVTLARSILAKQGVVKPSGS